MLILSRRVGEEIVIAGDVRIRVTKVHGKRVRLAVEAPRSVHIQRGEVHGRSLPAADASVATSAETGLLG